MTTEIEQGKMPYQLAMVGSFNKVQRSVYESAQEL